MNRLKYPLLVFLAACSYGILSTVIKIAYREGYNVGEVVNSQYFFGWLMLLIMVLSVSPKQIKMPFKQWFLLSLVGTTTGLTGIFYGISLQSLPASIAVILLFQFTWIGIAIEAISIKTFPGGLKIISTLLLLVGTVLASGVIGTHLEALSMRGIFYGLLSAFTYSIFIFVSGKIEVKVSALTRSLFMTMGSMVLLLCIFTPSFLFNGSVLQGLWKYGLILGLFGIVIPILFLAIGVPRVGSGISSILSAAELPVVVFLSVLILKENVTVVQWVGVIIILFGIGVPQVKWKKLTHLFMKGVNGNAYKQEGVIGVNVIKIANHQIYVIIAMFGIVITAVTYSVVMPAMANHEWSKLVVFAAVLLLVINLIKMRFGTIPLRIVFKGDNVDIKTLFGIKHYQTSDLSGIEYSAMGRMYPRHFLVLGNGDIYDIVSRKSAEEIEDYIEKYIEEGKN